MNLYIYISIIASIYIVARVHFNRHSTVDIAIYNLLAFFSELESKNRYEIRVKDDIYSGLGHRDVQLTQEERLEEESGAKKKREEEETEEKGEVKTEQKEEKEEIEQRGEGEMKEKFELVEEAIDELTNKTDDSTDSSTNVVHENTPLSAAQDKLEEELLVQREEANWKARNIVEVLDKTKVGLFF